MADRDLVRRIRLGEDARLEFKSVRVAGGRVRAPERRALADELAAFANSRGGVRRGPHAADGHARRRVPIIRRECRELSGRLPEYRLFDDSEFPGMNANTSRNWTTMTSVSAT